MRSRFPPPLLPGAVNLEPGGLLAGDPPRPAVPGASPECKGWARRPLLQGVAKPTGESMPLTVAMEGLEILSRQDDGGDNIQLKFPHSFIH